MRFDNHSIVGVTSPQKDKHDGSLCGQVNTHLRSEQVIFTSRIIMEISKA